MRSAVFCGRMVPIRCRWLHSTTCSIARIPCSPNFWRSWGTEANRRWAIRSDKTARMPYVEVFRGRDRKFHPMMLGSDVSRLTTTAANAAAQGLSIIVPVYNEAAGLELLHRRLGALATRLRQRFRLGCEVVYVDDGSTDATLKIARGLAAESLDVQVVSLSRNFGKEAALMAGLDHARRGALLFMDGDGQHPPALVEQLVDHWINGGYE